MSITTLAGLIAAPKIPIRITKPNQSAVANSWFSVFDLAGAPGAGVLAGTSTTTGVVPTHATAGCPNIPAFSGSAYLAGVEFSDGVAARMMVYDMLWKGGAYAFNANTTGQSPTSFSSRVPGGTDFTGTEIWLEQVTAGTGSQSVAVTYTDQDGNTGASTGTVVTAVNILGRMWPLSLASGDSGVQGVTGVVGTVASAGTFNILVLRPLWHGRVILARHSDVDDYMRAGLPEVFAGSALCLAVAPDGSGTGAGVEVLLKLACG